ncbi:hypothetical protein Gotri_012511 [Gossypium trilobum]|uniref:Uncharacterized protein n=1 Tax=Gossypium trilobum TaxID=34281 RepID=A0A7J9DQF9_9ROSI|nr:hypothetical protein [Gossypium trilobum]
MKADIRQVQSECTLTRNTLMDFKEIIQNQMNQMMETMSNMQRQIGTEISGNMKTNPWKDRNEHKPMDEKKHDEPIEQMTKSEAEKGTLGNRSSGDEVGPLAQRIRARGYDHGVGGSNPSSPTTGPKGKDLSLWG